MKGVRMGAQESGVVTSVKGKSQLCGCVSGVLVLVLHQVLSLVGRTLDASSRVAASDVE